LNNFPDVVDARPSATNAALGIGVGPIQFCRGGAPSDLGQRAPLQSGISCSFRVLFAAAAQRLASGGSSSGKRWQAGESRRVFRN